MPHPMAWALPEPMLISVNGPDLPSLHTAEPKWDGFRALVSVDAGRVVLRSRRGTEMGPAFTEVMAGPHSCRTGLCWTALCDLWGCLSPKVSQAAQLP
ncbi:DNA ligase-like domain-containing protein [Streptomyces avermitilis]|uniref:hypothetical protein n=2 Tax=Streptomyces avermitilis TaxID=33903 RepID=UPI0037F85BC5